MFGMRPFISKRTDVLTVAALFGGGSIGLLVGTLISELNGGIVLNSPMLFRFVWIGGVVFLPLAVFGGIVAEVHRETLGYSRSYINWENARIGVVMSSIIFFFAILVIIPLTVSNIYYANYLRSLPIYSVRKIEVYPSKFTPHDHPIIIFLDDPKVLSDFVEAARDVRVEHAGRLAGSLAGGTSEGWNLVILFNDEKRMRLDWSHRSDYPNSVVGHFYKFNSESTINRGDFISDNLRDWFDQHVLPKSR